MKFDLTSIHAEDHRLVVGELDLVEDTPFVRVPRVGALDVDRAGR